MLDIRIVDEKLSRVWKSLKDLRSAEVQTFVEVGIETAGVRKALRISESMALKLMRLLYSYDCTSLHCGGYLGSSVEATGSSISWDLRARDEESWGKEVLTAWNWTLRQWLKRGVVNGRDYWYVRAMEGGGVRDVIGAGRLEATLLDEFERLAV